MNKIILVFAVVAMFRPALFQSDRTSSQAPPKTAKPGYANHLLYDAQERQLMLVAPSRQSGQQELWRWSGKQWVLLPGIGPAARELGGAAYDTQRKRIVLYGGMGLGNRENRFGDTWEWDGKNWFPLKDTSVGVRDHHALAYDEARGKIVLFGGVKANDQLATETWEWDGRQWTQAATQGPGGRAHFPMVYDSVRRQIVLFGGLGEGYQKHNDTWAWDGKTWRHLSQEGPSRRTHLNMAFDRQAGVIVLFGGLAGGNPTAALADTWLWDGQQWKEIKTTGPAKRSGHVMTYDMARGKIVLYGGGSWDGKVATTYDDLWEWNGKQWMQLQ